MNSDLFGSDTDQDTNSLDASYHSPNISAADYSRDLPPAVINAIIETAVSRDEFLVS